MTRKAGAAQPAPLLTIPQVAEQLGISRMQAWRLTQAGILGCIELPGTGERRHRRVEQAEVNRFLEAHRRKATA